MWLLDTNKYCFNFQAKAALFVQQHLLKSSKSIRQLYGVSADADNKVREWVVLSFDLFLNQYRKMASPMFFLIKVSLFPVIKIQNCLIQVPAAGGVTAGVVQTFLLNPVGFSERWSDGRGSEWVITLQ